MSVPRVAIGRSCYGVVSKGGFVGVVAELRFFNPGGQPGYWFKPSARTDVGSGLHTAAGTVWGSGLKHRGRTGVGPPAAEQIGGGTRR